MVAENLTRQDAFVELEHRMVEITVNGLFNLMRGRFASFPNDYLVVDTETSGTDPRKDVITQMGHCLVKGRKVVDQAGLVLDWTRHPSVDQEWLRGRLISTKYQVEFKDGQPTGKTYHMSYERMRQEGANPDAVLREYLEWFKDIRQSKMFFVAHNGWHFDGQMFTFHFHRLFNEHWAFDDYELFDTGMVAKAAQSSVGPWPGETPKQFCARVYAQRLKGVRWALDTYCVPTFGLAEKYHLDMEAAHDADFDCFVTHLLMEEWRDMADRAVATGRIPA
jgi:DNA polymerase III epsilon subunit-like protein